MKTFVLLLMTFAVALNAEGPDLKRNQRVQKLAAHVLSAQTAYNGEMKAWLAECEAKGLTLASVAGNLMDCVARPQQPQAQLQRRPGVDPANGAASAGKSPVEAKEKDAQIDAQAKAKEKK